MALLNVRSMWCEGRGVRLPRGGSGSVRTHTELRQVLDSVWSPPNESLERRRRRVGPFTGVAQEISHVEPRDGCHANTAGVRARRGSFAGWAVRVKKKTGVHGRDHRDEEPACRADRVRSRFPLGIWSRVPSDAEASTTVIDALAFRHLCNNVHCWMVEDSLLDGVVVMPTRSTGEVAVTRRRMRPFPLVRSSCA
jgi:hypothetical protein